MGDYIRTVHRHFRISILLKCACTLCQGIVGYRLKATCREKKWITNLSVCDMDIFYLKTRAEVRRLMFRRLVSKCLSLTTRSVKGNVKGLRNNVLVGLSAVFGCSFNRKICFTYVQTMGTFIYGVQTNLNK